MRDQSPLGILWRRKWIVIVTFVAFTAGTAIVSKTLDKIYSSSATLLVVQNKKAQTFDAVQAAQVTARTYRSILASRQIAELVAPTFGSTMSASELMDAVTIEPVSETQLLKITADDTNAARSQAIANAYAKEFIEYAETNLAETTGATTTLATAAPLPSSPSRPKPTLYTTLAAIFGLALGVALAFIRDRLDTRLRTAEEIEERFGLPILARVPRRGKTAVTTQAFTEAFRVLRTNLAFATPEAPPRTIAVTSGNQGDGKTTVTVQLARASAEVDTRVLVVDGDLRRPALQQAVMPETHGPLRPGLSNYLVGAATLEEAIHRTGLPNIYIVPSGPPPPSLAGLLESQRGRTAVDDLTAHADRVIVDCPPLTVGANAAMLSGQVDAVLLVVDLEKSTETAIRDALRQLESVKANVVGFVLNRDKSAGPSGTAYDYFTDPSARRERAAARG